MVSNMDLSSSNSDQELFDTQTPNPLTPSESQKEESAQAVWGRLFPTTIYLPPVDLNKQYVLMGRAEDCDIVVTKKNFSPVSLSTVSKNHFMVMRGEECQSTFIKDLSKNGTFVNGNVVGSGNKIILEDDDEIAIGTAKHRVYVYKAIEKTPYLPPELKSKYEISRLLGSGACGEVRLAFDKMTFKEYAIKRIIKSKLDIKTHLNNPLRIQTEVKILQSLCHPCVISTKEIVETDEAVFIVLEYMEGGELTDLLKTTTIDEPLPENQVKLLFYQMVSGVRYLHLRDITHRDLKPGNILVKSSGTDMLIKISDFGLSKMIQSSTLTYTVCGTPSYVAPEMIDARCKEYTQQIDVWSLGVMLFNMLSSELPFKSDYQRELFTLIITGKYSMTQKPWNIISKEAKDLVSKMLVTNPEDRITIHEILNHPWITQDLDMQRRARQLMNEDCKPNVRETKRFRFGGPSA